MTEKIKKLFSGLAVLAIAALFISLGLWQLGRAQDLSAARNASEVLDQRIYTLPELTSPEGSLPVASYGKSVQASGHYIANYRAPNQIAADGSIADWEVALMQVDSQSAILVVRGLWQDRLKSPEIVMSTNVDITGRIFPSQYEDRAANTSSQLSRLDSSLLTSLAGYQLYDGFIAESAEATRSGSITRDRISLELPKGGIPGYYWQHISYVVIWWLMAGLVIWAPFYKRGEDEQAS
jgi:surfeit locus 1 family protein